MRIAHEQEFPFTRQEFDFLRVKATSYTGIQVGEEKYEMFYARLTKRLRILKLKRFSQYIEVIKRNSDEFTHFINAITTNVTSFFREQHHFDYLNHWVTHNPRPSLRIWSAGCSSGQEPYSLVFSLDEICHRQMTNLTIYATDIDSHVLHQAELGVYPEQQVQELSLETRRQFFLKGTGQNKGQCRVKQTYRDYVNFQLFNLVQDWTQQIKFDVIFCRNVIIYFDAEQKKTLIEKFNQHLHPGGLLFLGHSETLSTFTHLFKSVGKTIYQKRGS